MFSSTSFANPCHAPHATEMSLSSLASANRSQRLFSCIRHKLLIPFSMETDCLDFGRCQSQGSFKKCTWQKVPTKFNHARTILYDKAREYRCKCIQMTASVARNCNTMCNLFCNTLHRRQLAPFHSTDNFNYISK